MRTTRMYIYHIRGRMKSVFFFRFVAAPRFSLLLDRQRETEDTLGLENIHT